MDAQELRNLSEAYMEVYASQEELDEASSRDEFTRAAIARSSGSSGRKGGITFEPGPNWDPSANRGKGAHLSPKQKEKQRRKALRQENVDLYDIILSHLLDEGYADTQEAAEAIMVNMSEEWRESIVEEIGIVGPPRKAIDKIPGVRGLRIAASNAVKASDYPEGQNVPMAGKHVIPTERSTPAVAKNRPYTRSEINRGALSGITGKRAVGFKDISGD